MKEEVIYYSYPNTATQEHGFLYGSEPSSSNKDFVASLDVAERVRFLRCPAYQDSVRNLYNIGSQFDMEVKVGDGSIHSDELTQEFFDNYITNHSPEDDLYAVRQNLMFIAESDSLEITQKHPTLVDTDWSKDVMVVPGKIDIGKYFRKLECAFKIRKGIDKVSLKEGEPLYSIEVHTDIKVKLVPFYWSSDFDNLVQNMAFLGEATHKWKPLKFYYDVVKKKNIKKLIMKEIKKNLMV